MKRARRVLMVLAASLLLLGIPGGLPAQGQDEESTLFGYNMIATATALATQYDQPSFAIPQTPTFEADKVYTTAVLDSGPSGRANGTVLWLGDVASNAPPSLLFDSLIFNPTQLKQLDEQCLGGVPPPKEGSALAGFTCSTDPSKFALGIQRFKQFGSDNSATFPAYPVRAESFYPPGESTEKNIVAGMGMRSRAGERETEAYSTSGRVDGVPGLISMGSLESFSNSRVEKSKAIAEMRSRISDLDLFGVIHVDGIITKATAISDGVTATADATLDIVGMTITNPNDPAHPTRFVYDKNGLHERDATHDPGGEQARKTMKQLHDQYGISVTVGGPLDPTIEGASATRAVSGLIVHLDARGMGELMKRLPPRIRPQLLNPSGGALNPLFKSGGVLSPTVAGYLSTFFQGDQNLTFIFGSGAVQTAASPPFPTVDIPPLLPDIPLAPLAPPIDFGPGGGGGFLPGTPGGDGGGTTFINPTPVGVLGIPAGMLGLILFVGLAGAAGLRRVADIMTTTRAVGTRCPLEEP